jgi:hypothetical protein
MDINTEELEDNVVFDYLFTMPYSVNVRTLDSSIYTGINLIGTIHPNVFGGLVQEYDGNYLPQFTVINSPF